MNPTAFIFIKIITTSSMLFLFYLCLFRGKASHLASRLFLLGIPVLSLLFSLVTIDAGRTVAGVSMHSLLQRSNEARQAAAPPPATLSSLTVQTTEVPMVKPLNQMQPTVETVESDHQAYLTPFMLWGVLYTLVCLALVGTITRQMLRIKKIDAKEPTRYIGGIPIYSSDEVKSSFSIFRKIYVRNDVSSEKQNLIIEHEYQHIISRHYVDLVILEVMSVLLWFNPLVWVVRKELRTVHEFEADAKLLNNNRVEMRQYMIAILEETTGKIPSLANGLRGSLIKKRFMNMKKENRVTFRALRTALTLPFVVLLFAFVSCKPLPQKIGAYGARIEAEDARLAQVKEKAAKHPGELLFEARNSSREYELFTNDELGEKINYFKDFKINGKPVTCIVAINGKGEYVADLTDNYEVLKENDLEEGFDHALHNVTLGENNQWINPDGVALADWTRGWAVRYNAKAITNKRKWVGREGREAGEILRIEANDKETRITFLTTSYWDWCWRFTDSKTCLIDKATGDRYMIRDIEGDEEVGRLSILEGTNGKWFECTKIFPPLKKGVVMVDYHSPHNSVDAPMRHNATGDYVPNIYISKGAEKVIR